MGRDAPSVKESGKLSSTIRAHKHLKPDQYYIDLYDLLTIKKCLEVVKTFQEIYRKNLTDERLKELSQEEKLRSTNQLLHQRLFAVKASAYQRKEETINRWMADDRREQDTYDSTPEPQNISCPNCGAAMQSTFKDLQSYQDEPLRVLFFFDCQSCKKRRAIYEDGKEWASKPDLCSKCTKEVETTHTKEGKVMTWTKRCCSCGHIETDVVDWEKRHAEFEKKEQEDKVLVETYREEFCLLEKQGKEYIETLEALEVAGEVYEEEIQKFDSAAYQKATQLTRINIADLEQRLVEPLEKERYIKLSFEKPEEGRYFIVPFSVQDADSSRKANISVSNLQKLLKDLLEDTNWRLMNEGVSHRLGYISGRLRGYEREEDLLRISGEEQKERPSKVGQ